MDRTSGIMEANFPLFRLSTLLRRGFFRLALAPFLGSCGPRSVILKARAIEGIGNIHLGSDVFIAASSIIAAVNRDGSGRAELRFGDGCRIGNSNHIYATRSIAFEDRVLTAGNVYISDNMHMFEDRGLPIMDQPLRQLSPIRIGRGAWLGQNSCVIGASVGRGSVIGANSVVLKDVPDYCVAVGAPARVVRRFNPGTGTWHHVSNARSTES